MKILLVDASIHYTLIIRHLQSLSDMTYDLQFPYYFLFIVGIDDSGSHILYGQPEARY